jgi:hypothetical protein
MNVPNEPNEPTEGEFGISIPEGFVPDEAASDPEPAAAEHAGSAIYVLPEGYVTAEPPEPGAAPAEEPPPAGEPPAGEQPAEEPPIVRHDPFAHIRGAPWMDRALGASARAAAFLRRLLKDFAAIEGREPNRADIDDIVRRTADYMVPILKRERAADAAYEELEKRRAARIAAAMAAASASRGVAASTSLLRTPVPAAGPLTAAALTVMPTNSPNATIDLGRNLRASTGGGERTARLQQRVSVPLKYGLELGDWKELPVAAMKDRMLGGQEVLLIDPDQLRQAIGPEAAARVLSRPGIVGMPPSFGLDWTGPLRPLEIQIAQSTTKSEGKKVSYREVSQEEIERACPNLPIYERIGREAHADVRAETGLPNGPVFGTKVHKVAKDAARLTFVEEKLKAMGLVRMLTEFGLLKGKRSYQKGHARVDVLEIYDGKTACIIDYKTGGATVDDGPVRRYIRETALYIEAQGLGYRRIYFVPIFLN